MRLSVHLSCTVLNNTKIPIPARLVSKLKKQITKNKKKSEKEPKTKNKQSYKTPNKNNKKEKRKNARKETNKKKTDTHTNNKQTKKAIRGC